MEGVVLDTSMTPFSIQVVNNFYNSYIKQYNRLNKIENALVF